MERTRGTGRVAARYFRVAGQPQTYLNWAYLLLGLPLGVSYFVGIVVPVSVSAGLAVTLVGIPMLVASMFIWCGIAEVERVVCNVLLGTRIHPLSFEGGEAGYPWQWRRIKARLTNSATWRSLALLLLRFPQGIATFFIGMVLVAVPASMIAMPIAAVTGGGNFGFWQVDTLAEGAIFILPGILLVPLCLRIGNGVAYMSGRVTYLLLESPSQSPASGAVERATVAAATWQGLTFGREVSADDARVQAVQLRAFVIHAAVFGAVGTFFVILNGLTTPGTWWAVWPIWGFAMLLGLHAGYVARGFIGAHVGLFAVVNFGLFVINASYSRTWWFIYPLGAWGLIVLLHVYGARTVSRLAGERALLGWRDRQSSVSAPEAATGASAPQASGTAAPLAREEDHVADDAALDPAVVDHPFPGAGDATEEPGAPPSGSGNGDGGLPFATRGDGAIPPFTVDIVMRLVTVGGREVDLTRKEFDLLALFAQNPGRPFSRSELLDRIWSNDYEVTDRTIDTHVQRLRKKLGDQSEVIQTVWGVGYKFQTGLRAQALDDEARP